ncbi:endoglucanase [Caulobacter mirabilis]|uniref:Endoglucanase n=1 Tax=Caulobacter mirabilis TaxID=69666 RepID=A0A2D2B0C8_9CAUL|nr:endoglucanase [Caulobacter mirabilis]ATQ43706.1 endoglucanase [Caulobacter mirabilis]
MSLRALLRSGVAAACIVSVAVPAGVAGPAFAAPARLEVRSAQAKDFTRIEFRWAGGARVSQRRNGQTLTLRFSRDAKPDLSTLRILPPKWLKGAEARHVGGALEIDLLLADDADAKVGAADGAIFVNLFAKAETPAAPATQTAEAAPAAAAADTTPRGPRPNPIPAGGVVRMATDIAGSQARLRFDWANPVGAAVFRRGEAVWIVFDAPAPLDVSKAPRGLSQFSRVQAVKGRDYTAVRLVAPRTMPISVSGEGGSWTVALGAGPRAETGRVKVDRDGESARAALTAVLPGASAPVWINDPAVGDRIAVVTALAPGKGLTSRRDYVEMALLATAHGLAIEPYATDLGVITEGDLVRIGRPAGLALSPAAAGAMPVETAEGDGAPKAAGMPALVDETWGKVGPGGFMDRYGALTDAAAQEAGQGRDAPVEARMALARFLVGSELSYEAIGVLNAAARQNQTIAGTPEFRGLRGVARAMAGRDKEAETDFAIPILNDDPSSAVWRGYIAARAGQWADARAKFAQGAIAMDQFPAVWRARFLRADAEAALALGDVDGAQSRITEALSDKAIPNAEQLAVRLVQARMFEAQGKKTGALAVYKAIAQAPLDQLAAPALLHATQLELQMGKITPVKAAETFDGLRYRWRGGATELETIRALGQLYLGQGRYREALEALRSAGTRLPDLPQAVQLQDDLATAFRALFLDGMADGLEPIQALALFYDFKELTPVGADGDLMVRRLVRRLVDVDLLGQAADLLQYQVDNRLDGVPKAQVATDLALIQLMNRKPEAALQAINNSRTTVLPNALNIERRVITARALMQLGRLDAAQEIIESDKSPEARDIRAEIAWKSKNWGQAGALFETSMGERWKSPLPLRPDEESKLLRAGVAYSLAGDDAALGRLRQRYGGYVDQARNPDALRVAFAASDGGQLTANDFSRTVADNEGFAGWVAKMKQRFRDKPAPVGPSPVKAADASASTAAKG